MRTSTLQQMEDHNMNRGAPVLIRIYKEERTLEVWKQNRTGKFTLLQSYPICNSQENLVRRSLKRITKRPRDFTTSPRPIESPIERIPLNQHWFSERL